MDFEAGEILYVKKPLHWTSFDVVNRVRRVLCRQLDKKKLKVGHAGTLDPLASGVMILCTGKATKQIETLQYGIKEYVATLELGSYHTIIRLRTSCRCTLSNSTYHTRVGR